ncbi:hypothetical protein BGZ99_008747 [Dissophora globulifera]|uniref:Uncharacterized protein n=1 Tax=Dissophora globulifera TaxID=979702 RepID=A0A9P6UP27_9FUNG|nr:hypothetical protein BGZ99_008747 [Dissophora globulifera]
MGASGAGSQVQFPSTTSACLVCKPAFTDNPTCQLILDSIALGPTTFISNTTLAVCQCTPSFLSLYSNCVQCFTETNQVDLVFGSSQVPTQASLDTYCRSFSAQQPQQQQASSGVTVTKTVTKTSSTTATHSPTSSPSNPSSATAVKVYNGKGQPVGAAIMVYTAVTMLALAYFSVLS